MNSACTKLARHRRTFCPMPSALNGGKKSTGVEPVHSTVPAATTIHGALGNAIPASSGTSTGCKERMQRFQEEGCNTHAFLQMNGKQVQLQKKDGARNSVRPTHFSDKHMGSSVCRQELNQTKPVVFKCRKPNSSHLVKKLSTSE